MKISLSECLKKLRAIEEKSVQPYKGELNLLYYQITFAVEQKFILLEDGLVRANEACPFVNVCDLKTNCPKVNPTENKFSCGAARAHDLVQSSKKAREFMN